MTFLSLRASVALFVTAGVLALAGCANESVSLDEFAALEPEALANIAIKIEPGDERAVVFRNGEGAVYYDALAAPQSDEMMGLTAGDFRVLDGWYWWFPADSAGVGLADVRATLARPDLVVRKYVETDTSGFLAAFISRFRGADTQRLTEMVTLGEEGLVISIPDSVGTVEFFPAFSDRPADGYTAQTEGNVLAIARSNYLEPRGGDPRPVWVAIAGEEARPRTGSMNLLDRFGPSVGPRSRATAPGRVRIDTPGAIAISVGATAEEAAVSARRLLGDPASALGQRQQRALNGLNEIHVVTEDEHFNKAYQWARIALEDLVREDSVSADFVPGIPGRIAAPGWNTVQAMEGAFLVTGQWERAANMLRLYARNQRFDQRIDIFGRAPSRFDLRGRPEYSTADAQAQLVASLGDYLRTTGNSGLVLGDRRLFWTNPVYVQRGYDGPGRMRSPSGLIRSEQGESWLRARGDRPVSAIETQARYFENLLTMQQLARIMGVSRQAQAYEDSARVFQQRFENQFLQNGFLADHIGAEGPSEVARPTGLYALRSFDIQPENERGILRNIAERFAYRHGVATRQQSDIDFYPFLDEPDHYDREDALYEGTVWTALSGPLISLLAEYGAVDLAHEQLRTLEEYVLDRGVIGGIPENADAHPRGQGEEVAIGGAPVQPWSLAEFVRVVHQDFVGVRYEAGNEVVLQPSLPSSWGQTRSAFRMGGGLVRLTIEQSSSEVSVSLHPTGALPAASAVRIRAFGNESRIELLRNVGDRRVPRDSILVVLSPDGVTINGEAAEPTARYNEPDPEFWEGFAWVEPELQEQYAVMQRIEEERHLSAEQITADNPTARVILAQTDPIGDDWGPTATYTYPQGYPDRILDATYLEIARDEQATYFRIEMADLASAGEFGFQPTFMALAIRTEEGGNEQLGRNAQYRFSAGRGYNYVIFIGDGILVEDARGRVLGQVDALGDQIFDSASATVRFALPTFVMPHLPNRASITLIVGANDGGRPPGNFRTVAPTATRQYGGGKVNPRDPNFYDLVTATIRG